MVEVFYTKGSPIKVGNLNKVFELIKEAIENTTAQDSLNVVDCVWLCKLGKNGGMKKDFLIKQKNVWRGTRSREGRRKNLPLV